MINACHHFEKVCFAIYLQNFHQLWIQCQQRKLRSLIIGVVYRPPDCPISCLTNHLSPIMNHVQTLNKDVVLFGDLNCDMLKPSRLSLALNEFCDNYNLKQIIDKPTRVNENSQILIDVIIISNPTIVKESGKLDLTISDHFLIHVNFILRKPRQRKLDIQVRSYKNYNSLKFTKDIDVVPWHVLDVVDNIEDKVEIFNNLFLSALDSHAPVKSIKVSAKSIPFMTSEIKNLIIERDRCHRKARTSGAESDWCKFRELRRNVKLQLRKAEIVYIQEQIKDSKGDSNCIWKTIRQCLPTGEVGDQLSQEIPM